MMIFLTGCSGLVGSFIARKFLSEGYTVKALKRTNSDLSYIRDISPQIEWIEGDILDISLLLEATQGVGAVVHTAALVSFDPKENRRMYQINVEGTANIVNACLNNQVPKLCHISSVAALGRSKDKTDIDEKTQWQNSRLNSHYAISKYLSEMEVWRGEAEGLKTVILNPSFVIGPGDWNRSSTQVFKYVWEQKKYYTEGLINYVDVRDVAEIAFRLTLGEVTSERFVLNAGDISYRELFEKIAQIWAKKAPSIRISPWQTRLVWNLSAIYSFFSGRKPLITRETATIASQKFRYSSDKVRNYLQYNFYPLDESLRWACEQLIKKS